MPNAASVPAQVVVGALNELLNVSTVEVSPNGVQFFTELLTTNSGRFTAKPTRRHLMATQTEAAFSARSTSAIADAITAYQQPDAVSDILVLYGVSQEDARDAFITFTSHMVQFTVVLSFTNATQQLTIESQIESPTALEAALLNLFQNDVQQRIFKVIIKRPDPVPDPDATDNTDTSAENDLFIALAISLGLTTLVVVPAGLYFVYLNYKTTEPWLAGAKRRRSLWNARQTLKLPIIKKVEF